MKKLLLTFILLFTVCVAFSQVTHRFVRTDSIVSRTGASGVIDFGSNITAPEMTVWDSLRLAGATRAGAYFLVSDGTGTYITFMDTTGWRGSSSGGYFTAINDDKIRTNVGIDTTLFSGGYIMIGTEGEADGRIDLYSSGSGFGSLYNNGWGSLRVSGFDSIQLVNEVTFEAANTRFGLYDGIYQSGTTIVFGEDFRFAWLGRSGDTYWRLDQTGNYIQGRAGNTDIFYGTPNGISIMKGAEATEALDVDGGNIITDTTKTDVIVPYDSTAIYFPENVIGSKNSYWDTVYMNYLGAVIGIIRADTFIIDTTVTTSLTNMAALVADTTNGQFYLVPYTLFGGSGAADSTFVRADIDSIAPLNNWDTYFTKSITVADTVETTVIEFPTNINIVNSAGQSFLSGPYNAPVFGGDAVTQIDIGSSTNDAIIVDINSNYLDFRLNNTIKMRTYVDSAYVSTDFTTRRNLLVKDTINTESIIITDNAFINGDLGIQQPGVQPGAELDVGGTGIFRDNVEVTDTIEIYGASGVPGRLRFWDGNDDDWAQIYLTDDDKIMLANGAIVFGGNSGASSQIDPSNQTTSFGYSNVMNEATSTAMGLEGETNVRGQVTHSYGRFATHGDAQGSEYIASLSQVHGDATWYTLYADQNSSYFMHIEHQGVWFFRADIVGTNDAQDTTMSYTLAGHIIRNSSDVTSIGGTPTKTAWYEVNSNYDVRATADDTNEALKIEVQLSTGTSSTIRWVARIETTEVGF